MRTVLTAITVVLLTVGSQTLYAQPRPDLLIRHVTIVDVEHAHILGDQAVATLGSTIVAVGNDAEVAANWRAHHIVDARGRYLIPGLWDMHVHFGGGPELIDENKALLPLYVAYGITTVRDCSGDLAEEVLAWRRAIAAGTLFGPSLLSSGPKIEGIHPIWKGTIETGSRADVDAAIARLKQLEVDFVKITDNTLDPQLFLYAVERGRAAGFKVSGHIPMALTVHQAVEAGISSIEHLDYAFKAGAKDEAAIAADFATGRIDRSELERRIYSGFDTATAMRAYHELAQRGVYVTPTLNGSRILAYLDRDKHSQDDYLAYIGPGLRKTYEWRIQRAAQADANAIEQRHAHYERMATVLPLLQQAGVTIMAGTDAGFLNSFNYPGVGLHEELALYVDKGLTAAQALAAATRAGPAWFGRLDEFGSITAGRRADLVLLDGNPLDDIRATRSIHAVILRGTVYDRPALDRLLKETRTKVAAWNARQRPDGASTTRRATPHVQMEAIHDPRQKAT